MEKKTSERILVEFRVCEFDSTHDLHRVEPSSILLLSEVLASGVVPPDTTDMDYNEIENPDNIAGRVTNVFDAIDLSKEIAKSGANASALKPSLAGESQPVSAPSSESTVSSTLSGDK